MKTKYTPPNFFSHRRKLNRTALTLVLSGLSAIPIGCGVSGGPSIIASTETPAKPLVFTTGQAASAVIGQPDLTSNSQGTGASGVDGLTTITVGQNGLLYINDPFSNRVLGFPSVPSALPGPSASFVVGQNDFTGTGNATTASGFAFPLRSYQANDKFLVADNNNNRVLVYNTAPTATNSPPTTGSSPSANFVIGQTDLTSFASGCARNKLSHPADAILANGKVIVADSSNNRVLIYNSVPAANGADADLVLGQPDFTTCSTDLSGTKMRSPEAVWSDGTRLAVADLGANRVLIWNSFPTTPDQQADVVLGQPNLTTTTNNTGGLSASSMDDPTSIASNGTQFFVSDSNNNRVLMWNTFPKTNNQPADVVLGQTSFSTGVTGSTAASLDFPWDVAITSTQLMISDRSNYRVLIYESE